MFYDAMIFRELLCWCIKPFTTCIYIPVTALFVDVQIHSENLHLGGGNPEITLLQGKKRIFWKSFFSPNAFPFIINVHVQSYFHCRTLLSTKQNSCLDGFSQLCPGLFRVIVLFSENELIIFLFPL